jgi:hypothetical protein
LALYGLEVLRTWAEQAAVREAAEVLGLDLTTVEGVLAARAYVWGTYNAGLISDADWSGPTAEIAAQAMALYELAHPGALGRAAAGSAEDLAALKAVIGAALNAYAAGRLVPTEGDLAQGWVEVFPELTEDERRLGQLPGFTPERLDQFREAYPAEGPDLPNHTGQGPARDPTGSIISTPIPEERGPEIVESGKTGDFTTPDGNVVRNHGKGGTGEEYLLFKGHTPESIDDILQNPQAREPSLHGDTSTGGKQGATILYGRNGDWVVVNDITGEVISMNDRHNRGEDPPPAGPLK